MIKHVAAKLTCFVDFCSIYNCAAFGDKREYQKPLESPETPELPPELVLHPSQYELFKLSN